MLQPADPDWRDGRDERRGFHRVPTTAPVALLSTALGRVGGTLVDLSQTGCRLRSRARLQRGDRLVVTLGGIAPRAVTVAWAGEGEAGLAFAQPLHWTVVTDVAGVGRE